jgi:hypothetical protein
VETSKALLDTMLAGANEKSEMQVSLLLHPASRFRRIRSLGSHRHHRGVLETAPAAGTAAPDDAAPERPNGQKRMTEGGEPASGESVCVSEGASARLHLCAIPSVSALSVYVCTVSARARTHAHAHTASDQDQRRKRVQIPTCQCKVGNLARAMIIDRAAPTAQVRAQANAPPLAARPCTYAQMHA